MAMLMAVLVLDASASMPTMLITMAALSLSGTMQYGPESRIRSRNPETQSSAALPALVDSVRNRAVTSGCFLPSQTAARELPGARKTRNSKATAYLIGNALGGRARGNLFYLAVSTIMEPGGAGRLSAGVSDGSHKGLKRSLPTGLARARMPTRFSPGARLPRSVQYPCRALLRSAGDTRSRAASPRPWGCSQRIFLPGSRASGSRSARQKTLLSRPDSAPPNSVRPECRAEPAGHCSPVFAIP